MEKQEESWGSRRSHGEAGGVVGSQEESSGSRQSHEEEGGAIG